MSSPKGSSFLTMADEMEMDKIAGPDPTRAKSGLTKRGATQNKQKDAWSKNQNAGPGGGGGGGGDLESSFGSTANFNLGSGTEVQTRSPGNAAGNVNDNPSCAVKVKRAIRGLWRTRLMEDTKSDRELYVKTTIRELVIYSVFLAILCIMTYGMTSTSMYYFTKVMMDLFLETPFNDTKNNFKGLTNTMDYWRFTQGPMLDGLYWEEWYNGEELDDEDLGYIYYENKLLGVPRLRLLKVGSDSCSVHQDFENEISECYDSYSEGSEYKLPYGPGVDNDTNTAWIYQSEEELDGSRHWGLITWYGGGGYVTTLGKTRAAAENVVNSLKENLWVDRGTRAVFLDFTVYNANINLFCVVKIVTEFPATGGAIPHYQFWTVKLLRYVDSFDYFVLACECVFCLFIAYYIVEEILEIRVHHLSYLKSVWNCLDILIIVLALIGIGFSIFRTLEVNSKIQDLVDDTDRFADFEFLGFWETQFNSMLAAIVFFSWVKLFKYISFNKTMTQLSSTLARCAKDIMGFLIMFAIIFLAYAQFAYLVFGTMVKDFSTFGSCIFTLFRIILGDFDFYALEAANRVLGPTFFITYVFFVFFVLLNMFLAIINDTYSEVKSDIARQKNEFEIADYFKRGYNKVMNKLNFRKDKIIDLQKALRNADINQDKRLDFDEWRQELKRRGHAEAEIEAVFAKYDVDGDRVLDEAEQKRMHADLEGQKEELNNELEEVEKAQKTNRPVSGRARSAAVGRNQANGSRGNSSASSSDDENDSATQSQRGGSGSGSNIAHEEFNVLTRRVDRMEHSIGSIVSKIDAVLIKLEAMEKARLKRRETMSKLLDSISESEGGSDEAMKRAQMEKLVREELERWEADSPIPRTPSARSGRNVTSSMAEPESMQMSNV